MSIRKILFIVLAFLTTLTVFRLVWLQLFTTPDHPQAIQGAVDLRNWEGMSNYSIKLDGEWEFFPNTLLMQQDQGTLQPERDWLQVPGTWNVSEEASGKYGFGTYRLRILVDPQQGEDYAIEIPRISSSSEVFVNGELLAHSGKTGKGKQDYEPLNTPYTAYFTLEEADEIELIIQAANYDQPFNGGIVVSPRFGSAETINKEMSFSHNLVLIACIIYLLHALYSFIIFLLGRRDRRLLYFSLIIILVIIGTLIGERLLFVWLPLDFVWSIKVTNLSLLAAGFLLLQLIKQQLSSFLRAKLFRPYAVLVGLLALLSLFLPASSNMFLTYVISMFTLIPCILAVSVMYSSISRIDQDNIFLFLGVVAAVYSFIWLIIIQFLQIDLISYPFDLMIAIICFAVYFLKQYFHALYKTEQMMVRLQEGDKLKDDFLVSVAHEMKNPLHGMLNISQAVIEREKGLMKEESIRDLKLLVTVGRRMSLLLNDLLELERFKEKRITIQTKDVSVHSVAESVVDMLRFMTDGKKVKIINRIPANFPHVIADENRLNQILFNLLHNAIKFSYDGEVSVNAFIQDGWAKVSVADNGIGMEDEFVDQVFEPYKRSSSGNRLNESGIGLGLSICKELVELHGGTMEVSSKLNEGSVFTFTLKLSSFSDHLESITGMLTEAEDEQIAAAAEVMGEKESLVKRNNTVHPELIRILAIDDDPVNLKVLESIFSSTPYDIYTVTNGQDALSMIDRSKWDLIIADVMMPNMSGYELTSLIREKYSISELPVLLLTAYNREEGVEAGFRVGANDYVAKPMNPVELASRVKSLVKLKRSVSERLRMEAAWLQAQIKPHFILNTFNSIAALGRIDLDRMDALIEELSNYIRLSIDFQNSDGVAPLNRELQLVRSYLFIQKERFGDRVRVVWELDEHIQLNIPPLTIQPLVENAISHGILKRLSGGEIRIRIKDRGEHVVVSIVDNGVGMDEETLKSLLDIQSNKRLGIGLLNTDRRLKQFYSIGLKIESRLGVGTTVSFQIPKAENK